MVKKKRKRKRCLTHPVIQKGKEEINLDSIFNGRSKMKAIPPSLPPSLPP
jgi:hypothetical protein